MRGFDEREREGSVGVMGGFDGREREGLFIVDIFR